MTKSRHRPVQSPLVGIVTALGEEFAAMHLMLDECVADTPFPHDPNLYWLGQVATQQGSLPVVLTRLIKPGNNSAHGLATALLLHYPTIRDVIMVGIAAGIPFPQRADDHVRLGDIVVGTQGVLQYDNVRRVAGQEDEAREPPRTPSAYLLARVNELAQGVYQDERPWEQHLLRAGKNRIWARPPARTDVLIAPDGATPVRHPRNAERRPGLPRVHLGMIGSANILLRDATSRDQLRRRHRLLRAIEMEGSGIADAAWTHAADHLIVRGVCDYADLSKGDRWHRYAALVAAAYVRALLERYDPHRDAHPPSQHAEDVGGASGPERRHEPAPSGETLSTLRQLSAAAVADADVVDVAGPAGPGVRLSGGVYVPRAVEDEAMQAIAEGQPLVVIGEAGHGKTSLLWHLHRRLGGH